MGFKRLSRPRHLPKPWLIGIRIERGQMNSSLFSGFSAIPCIGDAAAELKPVRRCVRLTLFGLVNMLLAIYALLLFTDCVRWLPKGWPVLMAAAAAGFALLLLVVSSAVSAIFHWRFQLSIRSLFVFVVVFALPFILWRSS